MAVARARRDRALRIGVVAVCVTGLVAAVVAAVLAVRFRTETDRARAALRRLRAAPAARFEPHAAVLGPPALVSASRRYALPHGPTATLTLAAARLPGGDARVLVTGRVSGGLRGSRWVVIAYSCSQPDQVILAGGRAARDGAVRLRGRSVVTRAGDYWVVQLFNEPGAHALPMFFVGRLGRGELVVDAHPAGCPR